MTPAVIAMSARKEPVTARGLRSRGVCGLVACVATALLLVLLVASASADVRSLEVREYRHDFGVSTVEAEETLKVQDAGAAGSVPSELEAHLGHHYAGV